MLLYLHIPKTAGTTFGSLLERLYPESQRLHVLQRWVISADTEVDLDHYGRIIRERSAAEIAAVRDELDRALRKPGEPFDALHYDRLLKERSTEELTRADLAARPGLRLVYGHVLHGYDRLLGRECDYYTMLRDPFARLLSEYNSAMTHAGHVLHTVLHERGMTFVEYATSGYAWSADNLQTRLLAGEHPRLPFGACGEAQFEKALTHLKSFRAFGLAERFEQSLLLFAHHFGADVARLGYTRQRVGETFVSRSDLTAEEIARVEALNQWDRRLHTAAGELFAQRLAEARLDLQGGAAALRAACRREEKIRARERLVEEIRFQANVVLRKLKLRR